MPAVPEALAAIPAPNAPAMATAPTTLGMPSGGAVRRLRWRAEGTSGTGSLTRRCFPLPARAGAFRLVACRATCRPTHYPFRRTVPERANVARMRRWAPGDWEEAGHPPRAAGDAPDSTIDHSRSALANQNEGVAGCRMGRTAIPAAFVPGRSRGRRLDCIDKWPTIRGSRSPSIRRRPR